MNNPAARQGGGRFRAERLSWPVKLVLYGSVAGLVAALLTLSVSVAITIWSLALALAWLWRPGEIPALPIVVSLQWVFVLTGPLYLHVTGELPFAGETEILEEAAVLSSIGLLVVVAGIVAARNTVSAIGAGSVSIWHGFGSLDLRRLSGLVAGLYVLDWFIVIQPMQVFFEAAQFLRAGLAFKRAMLLLLFIAVLYQRKGYRYLLGVVIVAFVPALGSFSAAFAGLFVLWITAVLAVSNPHNETMSRQPALIGRRLLTAGLGVVTVLLALLWQGGLKSSWRSELREGTVSSPVARVARVTELTSDMAPVLDWQKASRSLVQRLSSAEMYFGYALERVPSEIPHAQGELTRRTLTHLTRPRIFFPEKENLGSDSWIVEKYAGIPVAGPEQGTSIGMGYVAESYIDFGIPVMFVPLFLMGVLVGSLYEIVRRIGTMPSLAACTASVLLLNHFASYGGNYVKIAGGLAATSIVFGAVLLVVAGWASRFLRAE